MKIALAILHADPARGGAERYTADLARALRERGHEVTLITASPSPETDGGESVLLPYSGPTRLRRYLTFIDALESLRSRRSFDILHAMLPVRACDVYHPHAGLAADAVADGHRNKPTRWEQTLSKLGNRLNAKRQTFAAVERELLQASNPPVVLGLSDYVNRSVRRQFPTLPADRLVKLFNAVDLQRFDPTARPDAGAALRTKLGLPGNAVVGVMLAHDFARKGLSEAIAAMERANDRRLHLLVAGRQNPAPYRRSAELSGIGDRIRFTGPTDDPYAFYAAAHFYVLPTRHDPCSLGVLEALTMGVPVISTVFNGACEIMTTGVHGTILSDPFDVSALSHAMRVYLDSSQWSDQSRACLLLRPSLSFTAHVDRVLGAYARVQSHAS